MHVAILPTLLRSLVGAESLLNRSVLNRELTHEEDKFKHLSPYPYLSCCSVCLFLCFFFQKNEIKILHHSPLNAKSTRYESEDERDVWGMGRNGGRYSELGAG